MSENKDQSEKVVELLKELVKWTKVTSIPQVAQVLEEQVHSPAQRIVYKFSDGKRSRKDLSEMSGIDPADISRDWKKWARAGIAEQIPSKGGSRGKSLFSLEDFGLEVPDVAEAETGKGTKTQEKETESQGHEVETQ